MSKRSIFTDVVVAAVFFGFLAAIGIPKKEKTEDGNIATEDDIDE